MNKFEEAYAEFLREQRPMKNVTPGYVGKPNPQRPIKNITNAPGSSSRTISPAALPAPASSKPSLSGEFDKIKRIFKKAYSGIKNTSDPLMTGLSKMGGYSPAQGLRALDIRVNNTELLKQFISQYGNTPEGATDNYFYRPIDVGTSDYEDFVEMIKKMNSEAADRFEDMIRNLDATKQNYIEIKSSVPGIGAGDREKIIVGKIGDNVYAYYPKPDLQYFQQNRF